jgi:aspartate aminotransferase
MAEIFSACPHLSFLAPRGAFYFFLNVERVLGSQYNHDGIIASSDDLAFFLLNAYHVSTVAGSGFGAPGCLRLSFACADADVEEGSKRIVEAVNKLAESR